MPTCEPVDLLPLSNVIKSLIRDNFSAPGCKWAWNITGFSPSECLQTPLRLMTHFCVRNVDSSFTQGVWLWPDWLISLATSSDKWKRQSHVFWAASCRAQQLCSSSSTSGWWSFRLSALGCEQRRPPSGLHGCSQAPPRQLRASGGQLDWPSGATRRWGVEVKY